MDDDYTDSHRKNKNMHISIATLIVVVLWIGNLAAGYLIGTKDRGSFGDMFGAVNSIFSGMAFLGVIFAIAMQRHEISIAKREIKMTKKILDKQQEQLEIQNSETKKQAFEATYFQLVRLFTDITGQIDLQRVDSSSIKTTKGKDVFPIFLKIITGVSRGAHIEKNGDGAIASYEFFYRSHNTELGHYFRMLYNILSFIDKSDIEDKYFYARILRAQLSDAEAAIVFYNGLSSHGIRKFKPLIEKYGILKNCNMEDIIRPELKSRYDSSAFGEQ